MQRAPWTASILRASRSMSSAMCSVFTTREVQTLSCRPRRGAIRRDLRVTDLVPAARRYKIQEIVDRNLPQPAGLFADVDKFVGALQSGDVILFEGLDPFAALLQWIDGTPFNHAAIFLGCRNKLPKELQESCPMISMSSRCMLVYRQLDPQSHRPRRQGHNSVC